MQIENTMKNHFTAGKVTVMRPGSRQAWCLLQLSAHISSHKQEGERTLRWILKLPKSSFIKATPPQLSETRPPPGSQKFKYVSLWVKYVSLWLKHHRSLSAREYLDCTCWGGKTRPLWAAPFPGPGLFKWRRGTEHRAQLPLSVSWQWCDPLLQAPALWSPRVTDCAMNC